MSESSAPLMLCATKVLKPGPARIGRIGGNITLPRTVPLPVFIAGGIGFGLGVIIASVLSSSFTTIVIAGTLGAGLGWVAVTYSPLRGESLGQWASLEVTSRLRRVNVQGVSARVYVGICAVPDVAAGTVHIVSGAVNVLPGSVDDRGRFRPVDQTPVLIDPGPAEVPGGQQALPPRTGATQPPQPLLPASARPQAPNPAMSRSTAPTQPTPGPRTQPPAAQPAPTQRGDARGPAAPVRPQPLRPTPPAGHNPGQPVRPAGPPPGGVQPKTSPRPGGM